MYNIAENRQAKIITAPPKRTLPEWLPIGGGYIILTAIFTFPFVTQLNSHIMGDAAAPTNDAYHSLWYLWWYGRALELGQDPTQTSLMFGLLPSVQVLVISVVNGIMMLPLRWLFGSLVAYNFTIFVSFPLAGFFTYQLAGEVTTADNTPTKERTIRANYNQKLAWFVAGCLFAFSTYHLYRAQGHMGLATIQWLPFYAWRLFALRRAPMLINALLAGLGFALAALSDLHYVGFFVVPFTLGFVLWFGWFTRKQFWQIKNLSFFGIAWGLGALITAPFYLSFLRLDKDVANTISTTSREARELSADLLAFFLPNSSNPLFGSLTTSTYANFTGKFPIEQAVYPGYVLLVAALVALFLKKFRKMESFFWVLLALIGFVFALGPRLYIGGVEFGFPMPYTLYTYLPLLNTYRTPNRFVVLMLLALAILAAQSLAWLFSKVRFKGDKLGLASLLVLLALAESLVSAFPMPTGAVHVPDIYRQIAAEPGDFLVLELPLAPLSLPLYYQTLHQKRLVGGYPLRLSNQMTLSFDQTPYLSMFNPAESSALMDGFAANIDNPEIFPLDISFKEALQSRNIRYVLLRSYPEGRRFFRWMRPYLEKQLGDPFWSENDRTGQDPLLAWRVVPGAVLPVSEPNQWRMSLGEGWNAGLGISPAGKLLRVMRQDGKLWLEAANPITLNLNLRFTPVIRPQTVELRLNGTLIGVFEGKKEWVTTPISFNKLALKAGQNILELHSKAGCLVVGDFLPASPDRRCISLFVQDIKLETSS